MVHFEIKHPFLQDCFADAQGKDIPREQIIELIAKLPLILPPKNQTLDQDEREAYKDIENILQTFQRLLRENPKEKVFKFAPISQN